MKRDWNLIKELLLLVEQDPELLNTDEGFYLKLENYCEWVGKKPDYIYPEVLPNYELQEKKAKITATRKPIATAHLELMRDEKLIKGYINFEHPRKSDATLTLKGYDLLAFMKDPEIWRKIYKALTENKIPVTYITIMELGKKITLAKIEELKF